MRKRHVREMNVRDAAHGCFGGRTLDAELVETDPRKLHRLNGEKDRCQRNGRKAPLDQQRGGGMVDGKHLTFNLRRFAGGLEIDCAGPVSYRL